MDNVKPLQKAQEDNVSIVSLIMEICTVGNTKDNIISPLESLLNQVIQFLELG